MLNLCSMSKRVRVSVRESRKHILDFVKSFSDVSTRNKQRDNITIHLQYIRYTYFAHTARQWCEQRWVFFSNKKNTHFGSLLEQLKWQSVCDAYSQPPLLIPPCLLYIIFCFFSLSFNVATNTLYTHQINSSSSKYETCSMSSCDICLSLHTFTCTHVHPYAYTEKEIHTNIHIFVPQNRKFPMSFQCACSFFTHNRDVEKRNGR